MRRFIAVVTAIAAMTLGAVAVSAAPAQAADGRAVSAQGEIRAILLHTQGRNPDGAQPDRHSVPHYMVGVNNLGCQWGIIDATWRMATSEEAKRRWGYNHQNLAGMLYAGPLDRAPDPGGLQTYTRAIGTYGLGWATRQMMGSTEYRTRLQRICNPNGKLSASMYDHETAAEFLRTTMLDDALNMAKLCGSQKMIEKLTAFKDNAKKGRAYVGIAGEGARVLNGWLGNKPCQATLEITKAMAYAAYIIYETGYDGHNPVFIQLSATHNRVGMLSFTYRVGENPTSWKGFSGKSF